MDLIGSFFRFVADTAQKCEVSNYKEIVPAISLEDPIRTPFHIVSLVIFVLAIIHTLLAYKFTELSRKIAKRHHEKIKAAGSPFETTIAENGLNKDRSFAAEILHFLGEVEVIFGIWVIPLLIAIFLFYNWDTAVYYIDNRNYIEPVFVVVIMCVAATRPIVSFTEKSLKWFANLFGGSLSAWWFSILTIGPILGSFITEAGAMTISAVILARQFYEYRPSKKLAYATLGLLFVNISVGGILTNFAAPPVLIVAHCWQWSSWFMMSNFGWKAVSGILISNGVFFAIFRKEFRKLNVVKEKLHTKLEKHDLQIGVPRWITLCHILLLIWLVINSHDPPIFIGSFLLFLGFHQATSPHQYSLNLKRPILVGFFLAGLVIHGGLQGWWIIPLLGRLQEGSIMSVGAVLTAFNDNAAVTYLSSLVPNLTESLKKAIVSGVVVGGGLTVIANAPNPAGQMLLRKYFKNGVSPIYLFLGAIIPTLIFFLIFYFSLFI